MKNLLLILTVGFIALSFNGYSQLQVISSGYVGINEAAPAYNLHWFGTGCFGSTWGRLMFNSTGNGGVVCMHPAEDWVGALGKSDKRFNTIYTYTLYYDNLVDWSDEKLKENIKPLENSLSKIRMLKGVSYNMKKEFYKTENPELLSRLMEENKNDMGFLAQEIKEVFPEVVTLDSTSNMYSVNYVKLIPVMVEAIKEQQAKIEELEKAINKLTGKN